MCLPARSIASVDMWGGVHLWVVPATALLVVVGSCATPSLRVLGRGGCGEAEPDEVVLFCDERGRLVTCAGGSPLPAADGIQACVTLEGAPYLVTCAGTNGPGRAELLPCPACGPEGEGPSLVTLAADACLLDDGRPRPEPEPEPEPERELEPEPERDLEPESELEPEPERDLELEGEGEGEGDREGDFSFEASALDEPLPCDIWAEEPCPEDHECRIEVDPPICERVDEAPEAEPDEETAQDLSEDEELAPDDAE